VAGSINYESRGLFKHDLGIPTRDHNGLAPNPYTGTIKIYHFFHFLLQAPIYKFLSISWEVNM
jgi:hypothetical protein